MARRRRPVAVLGCTSDAGKSLIAAALCRWYARRGLVVAPFKAQNMSNNARVVPSATGEGEIGVAQWLQARAAGIEPDVRMNPVLLKPEAMTRSQVVVRGRFDPELSALPWNERHGALWTAMSESFDSLAAEVDLVVIEGAGSPAEINLVDQVNNRMVAHADAAALLVSDIDRGGSFAHLYGTWALVPDATRERLAGFVLNRFRGDPSLLAPGPERLEEMTGMACAGVLPMLDHDLPREEGFAEGSSGPADAPRMVLPRFPFGSNLDEFHLASRHARLTWAEGPREFMELDPARDLVVLPGSKNVGADLAWLRERGMDEAVGRAAAAGVRVVGVCGGAMMMGQGIADPAGLEGGAPWEARGLGLVGHATDMQGGKRTARTVVRLEPPTGGGFDALAGRSFTGYEIRLGRAEGPCAEVAARNERGRPVAWGRGRCLATLTHGLFEDEECLAALLGVPVEPVLERTFERLADAIEEHLDGDLLMEMASLTRG